MLIYAVPSHSKGACICACLLFRLLTVASSDLYLPWDCKGRANGLSNPAREVLLLYIVCTTTNVAIWNRQTPYTMVLPTSWRCPRSWVNNLIYDISTSPSPLFSHSHELDLKVSDTVFIEGLWVGFLSQHRSSTVHTSRLTLGSRLGCTPFMTAKMTAVSNLR